MFATLLAKENRLSLGICKFGSYSLSSPRHCHQSRWLQPIKTGKACSRKKGYQVDDSLANQTKNSLQEKKTLVAIAQGTELAKVQEPQKRQS